MTERLANGARGLEQRFHFEPAVVADPRDVRRLDRELAARRTCYMKELTAAIIALEKRINAIAAERRALWQRLGGAFNQRMLARHNAKTARLLRAGASAQKIDWTFAGKHALVWLLAGARARSARHGLASRLAGLWVVGASIATLQNHRSPT